jgi:hypothetical protein
MGRGEERRGVKGTWRHARHDLEREKRGRMRRRGRGRGRS